MKTSKLSTALGTVAGVQLAAVPQFPAPPFQVALTAWTCKGARARETAARAWCWRRWDSVRRVM
jgi:hypothetical protein